MVGGWLIEHASRIKAASVDPLPLTLWRHGQAIFLDAAGKPGTRMCAAAASIVHHISSGPSLHTEFECTSQERLLTSTKLTSRSQPANTLNRYLA